LTNINDKIKWKQQNKIKNRNKSLTDVLHHFAGT